MIVHHTTPKSSRREFARRFRRGMFRGNGQVLRRSIGQGLFGQHLRRLNRYVFMLGYLAGAGILVGVALGTGEPAPLLRANLNFRGVEVTAGEHVIEMSYAPTSLRLGWLLAATGILAVVFAALRGRQTIREVRSPQ